MYCQECGAELKDEARFCHECGAEAAMAENEPNFDHDEDFDYAETEFAYDREEKSSEPAYAGFWIRLAAYLIDGVVLGGPVYLISTFLVTVDPFAGQLFSTLGLPIIIILFWVNWHGQSPGKRIMNIRIITKSGGAITFGRGVLRYIGYILSGFLLMIGFIMVAFHGKKRGLHDIISGTYVIKDR
ncbi:RDD family protein [Halarsenatibacter silvermanii]|uniref:Uncharacterized membrane protein YckC, RDD family n=1 Tax=Halarsenatibacter silvermanii TaxID=321763 RepID=A0A1G9J286_9FIRM|nr:RDD family protein [Halarsenatibacter silvermanii]SDL31422.1 Uncharacterized membrane protein YckC, RDD family [Halarsenatibacter silvermanii]